MRLPAPLLTAGLKARSDFVAIVSQYTFLRRVGRQYVGLCPFHSERHPSFYVHPAKKIYYCFGCGAGGDVFAFVMRANDCDFRRALEIVAEFSQGVVRESDSRSGSRFRAGVGASPPAVKRLASYSPKNPKEPRIFRDAWRGPLPLGCDLARDCEPETRGPFFTCTQRITPVGRDRGNRR